MVQIIAPKIMNNEYEFNKNALKDMHLFIMTYNALIFLKTIRY